MSIKVWRRLLRRQETSCAIWIALLFALTSFAYLSWVYHMVALAGVHAPDWFSLVLGYLCQAAGAGIVYYAQHNADDGIDRRHWLSAALFLFGASSIPALLSDSLAGTVGFGLLMNLSCGIISGLYLCELSESGNNAHISLLFGGSYAAGILTVSFLAVIGNGTLVRSSRALLVCLPSCLCLGVAARKGNSFGGRTAQGGGHPAVSSQPVLSGKTLALACAAVLMASLVKDMGFTFPSSDIASGLKPEFSRIFYGLGLIAAGVINDHNRKTGFICTVAALSIPFIMLSMQSEPVSRAILWGLDYFFYGFFSVNRVVLFIDLARKTRKMALAPLGLLIGRLGDAVGTALGLLLAGFRPALILTTALCFALAVLLLFRLYQEIYEPKPVERKSEKEIFDLFCLRHDLSVRERDILRLLLDNRTNAEISDALFISGNTVKYHVRNVLQKTGCKNRVDLQKKYKLTMYSDFSEAPELKLL